MASLNKPTSLPLSMVTTSPKKTGMNFSLAPSASFKDSSTQPVKKKSFNGLDRLKKFVSRREKHKDTLRSNGVALPTVVVTPTDESIYFCGRPTKSIVQTKSFSNSAEDICSSDNVAISFQSSMDLLAPISVKPQRPTHSDENLFLKEEVTAPKFCSSENIMSKEFFTSNLNKEDCRSEGKEKVMLLDSGLKTETKFAEDEIQPVEEKETLSVGMDLNEVQRDHGHLGQSAAMHRKNLRPKNRRPPTIYGRGSQEPLETDQSLCTENLAMSVPHLPDVDIHTKLRDENTCTSLQETSVSISKDDLHSSKVSKAAVPLAVPLALKRGKRFIPRPDDPQKNFDRRKTIGDFKMTDTSSEKSNELEDLLDLSEVSQPKREMSLKSNLKENIPVPAISESVVDNKDQPFKEKKFPHELLAQRKSKLISAKVSNIISTSEKEHPDGGTQETNQSSLLTKIEKVDPNDIKPSTKTFQSSLSVNLLDSRKQSKPLVRNECSNEGVKKLDGNKLELGKMTDKPERPIPPKHFVLKCASNNTHLRNTDDVVDKKLQKSEVEKLPSSELSFLKPGVTGKTKSNEKLYVPAVTKSTEPKELVTAPVDVKNQENKTVLFEHTRARFSSDDKSGSFKQVQNRNADDKGTVSPLPEPASVKPSNMFLYKGESKIASALQIKELPQEPFKAIRNAKPVPIPVEASAKDKSFNFVAVDVQNNQHMSSSPKPVSNIPKEKVAENLEDHPKYRNLKSESVSFSKNASIKTCDKDSSGAATGSDGNIKTPLVRPAPGTNSKLVPSKLNIGLKDSNDWMIARREKSERSS